MYMHATSWLEELFGSDPFLFSKQILEDDLTSIVQLYRREGLLNVRLEEPIITADHDGKTLAVHIPIIEGEPVLVDTVTVSSPGVEPAFKTIHDSLWHSVSGGLCLKSGVRFRDEAVRQDRGMIASSFATSGFPFASIQYTIRVDTMHNTSAVVWSMATGPQITFGAISYTGTKRLPASILKKRLAFSPSTPFDESKLAETERAIYALLLHTNVTAKPLYEEAQSGIVPVEITVQEADEFQTWFSVGYGQEEKLRGAVRFTWKGLFRGTSSFRLAVEHSALNQYSFSGWYVDPGFFIPRTTFIAYPFKRRETEPSYTANRTGIRFSLQRPVAEEVHGALSYTIENVGLDLSSISQVNQLGPLLENYWKSSVILTANRTTAEPLFTPRSGTNATVILTVNGKIFDTPYGFLRLVADFRSYHDLWETLVLAWRLKAGAVSTNEEHDFIPIEERFYSGGATSVRGWKRFELGPIDNLGKPIGGNSLFEGSLELRFPLWNMISGVAFMDFGNVWIPSFTYRLNEIRYSAGAGIRIGTPIGPVRLDAAVPVFDDVNNWQWIFSFGQAF
jgi:outer membrane protein insertion porin family